MAGAVEPGAPGGFFNIIPMLNKIYITFFIFVNSYVGGLRREYEGTSYNFPYNQLSRVIITNRCKIRRGKRAI